MYDRDPDDLKKHIDKIKNDGTLEKILRRDLQMNRVTLIGRPTKDPEPRTTSNGVSVAPPSTLAVDRRFGDNENRDFIPIVTWWDWRRTAR